MGKHNDYRLCKMCGGRLTLTDLCAYCDILSTMPMEMFIKATIWHIKNAEAVTEIGTQILQCWTKLLAEAFRADK